MVATPASDRPGCFQIRVVGRPVCISRQPLLHIARVLRPKQRAGETFNFDCGSHRYVATVSNFPNSDRLVEIFLGDRRAGSEIDAAAKDSVVVASLSLQHGVPVDVIRKALLRDSQGRASSPLGCALDFIVADNRTQQRVIP